MGRVHKRNKMAIREGIVAMVLSGAVAGELVIAGNLLLIEREGKRKAICQTLGGGGVLPYDSPRIYGQFQSAHKLTRSQPGVTPLSFVPNIGPALSSSKGIDAERVRCAYEFEIGVSRSCAAQAVRATLARGDIKLSPALVGDARQEEGECK